MQVEGHEILDVGVDGFEAGFVGEGGGGGCDGGLEVWLQIDDLCSARSRELCMLAIVWGSLEVVTHHDISGLDPPQSYMRRDKLAHSPIS